MRDPLQTATAAANYPTRKRSATILVLAKVKEALYSRGVNGVRGMGRIFRRFDSADGDRRIDREEFYVGLKELGVTNISNKEAEILMDYLDKNQDGTIDYDEFLVGIRVSTMML